MKAYKVYFDNNCETVFIETFDTIEAAKAYCEERIKGATLDELGGCTDDVFYSSKVGHLEVYENAHVLEDEDGDMVCEDPLYTSQAFYTGEIFF